MKTFTIKQGGMIEWQVLAISVLLLLGSLQLADGQEVNKNELSITQPQKRDKVGRNFMVEGKCTIYDNSKIWVFVYRKSSGESKWKTQEAKIDKNKNNWHVFWASIGAPGDIGSDFEIVAATFDDDVQKIKKCLDNNITVPISSLKVTSNKVVVTVKKK